MIWSAGRAKGDGALDLSELESNQKRHRRQRFGRCTPYTNETATTIYRGARRFSSSADSLELRVPAGQATTARCKRECERKHSAGNHIFAAAYVAANNRSEEHTSELQSLAYLVCRLLLEKKKKKKKKT